MTDFDAMVREVHRVRDAYSGEGGDALILRVMRAFPDASVLDLLNAFVAAGAEVSGLSVQDFLIEASRHVIKEEGKAN
jgi:hypothetical protein